MENDANARHNGVRLEELRAEHVRLAHVDRRPDVPAVVLVLVPAVVHNHIRVELAIRARPLDQLLGLHPRHP